MIRIIMMQQSLGKRTGRMLLIYKVRNGIDCYGFCILQILGHTIMLRSNGSCILVQRKIFGGF